MSFFDIWRQSANQIRHNNTVLYGNAIGAIPREAIAESVAPVVPAQRRTRDEQYEWAKQVIEQAIKEGRLC